MPAERALSPLVRLSRTSIANEMREAHRRRAAGSRGPSWPEMDEYTSDHDRG